MAATVVVRQLTSGSEAARILDELDAAIEAPSDRLSTGRRYSFDGVADREVAIALLESELDRIDGAWPTHVAIHGVA
jgi:hypothetical protein